MMADLGPLPERHPREELVDQKVLELETVILGWVKDHGGELTSAEYLLVLQRAFGGWITRERSEGE